MDTAQRHAAKVQLIAGMQRGQCWQEAAKAAGLQISQASAYRLLYRVRTEGEVALHDRRHGHASKLREPIRQWLEGYCRASPACTSRTVQTALYERFGVWISITHLNRVRVALGVSRHPQGAGENQPRMAPQPDFQDGAGNLLLLAAVHETGLLAALEGALPAGAAVPARLAKTRPTTQRQCLLTLLFLGAVGLRRPWDLRGYTGQGLALLTGRTHAYGYWHIERFLAHVAQAGSDQRLTDALGRLDVPSMAAQGQAPACPCYVDGHRKAVYADHLIPRGLVARYGKVLGCRALVLLHDAAGHPLLATTHRGDLHLTVGAPSIVARYEAATQSPRLARLIIDREGMSAEFLASLAAEGRTVVTVLRTDQYTGLASFQEVGPFVPLRRDRQGNVVREVAPARFQLSLPEQPGKTLPVAVALIRDLRRQVPAPGAEEEGFRHWFADLPLDERAWWEEGWQATPMPGAPTEPKLIPIVTTAAEMDPLELAQTYSRRWPAQENVIKDWLLPLGWK